jgi:hypothetical protein
MKTERGGLKDSSQRIACSRLWTGAWNISRRIRNLFKGIADTGGGIDARFIKSVVARTALFGSAVSVCFHDVGDSIDVG